MVTTKARTISISLEQGEVLEGILAVPEFATGIVLLAHASGSSRLCPRNVHVGDVLFEGGVGILIIDLLSQKEEQLDPSSKPHFNVTLLGDRLVEIIDWVALDKQTEGLNIGLFGASTAAAATILAASRRQKWVDAIVSRSGRLDLAADALTQITAPTLLIVGSLDHEVLKLNQDALAIMTCLRELTVIDSATHMFDEANTLTKASESARDWFLRHLK